MSDQTNHDTDGDLTPTEELLHALRHQQQAMAEEEPFNVLRRDAEALGARLSLSLPLPVPDRLEERYYADWLDEEGRRQPALDTDILLWEDPVQLISRSLEAVAEQDSPASEIVILDESLGEVARLSP